MKTMLWNPRTTLAGVCHPRFPALTTMGEKEVTDPHRFAKRSNGEDAIDIMTHSAVGPISPPYTFKNPPVFHYHHLKAKTIALFKFCKYLYHFYRVRQIKSLIIFNILIIKYKFIIYNFFSMFIFSIYFISYYTWTIFTRCTP